MRGRRNTYIAREGIPFLFLALVACWLTFRHAGPLWAIAPGMLAAVLYHLFRDPPRVVPSSPLGVVSPVDGEVIAVEHATSGVLQGEAWRVVIRINGMGTYTARSPVEGKILIMSDAPADRVADYRTNALWLQTDEGDDVVLQFTGYRFGIPPKSFAHYGERLGQGARCAYLRLTRYAEVHMPITSQVLIEKGQQVAAGSDLIGKLPHP